MRAFVKYFRRKYAFLTENRQIRLQFAALALKGRCAAVGERTPDFTCPAGMQRWGSFLPSINSREAPLDTAEAPPAVGEARLYRGSGTICSSDRAANRNAATVDRRRDGVYLSSRQATPGSSFPSMNSREAPPPVEIWVILSA